MICTWDVYSLSSSLNQSETSFLVLGLEGRSQRKRCRYSEFTYLFSFSILFRFWLSLLVHVSKRLDLRTHLNLVWWPFIKSFLRWFSQLCEFCDDHPLLFFWTVPSHELPVSNLCFSGYPSWMYPNAPTSWPNTSRTSCRSTMILTPGTFPVLSTDLRSDDAFSL